MAIPSLKIPVDLDMNGLKQQGQQAANYIGDLLGNIQSQFESANSSIAASTSGSISKIGLALTGAFAAAAVESIRLVNGLSDLGDRADDLRLPVNLLQSLSVAAAGARVSQEQLNSALDKFTAQSKKSSSDAEQFYTALRNVGGGFEQAFKNAPTQAERLRIISDALKSTNNEGAKANLAVQAFGTDSQRMLSVLGSGRSVIDEQEIAMRKLGLAIDENAVQAAQKARSELGLLARVAGDDLSSALAKLIPILVKLEPYLKLFGTAFSAANMLVENLSSNPASMSAGTLSFNLETEKKNLDELIEKRNRLAAGESDTTFLPGVRDTLRKALGIDNESVADLDKAIADTEKKIASYQQFLADAEAKQNAPASDGGKAFKERPSLKSSTRDRFDASADSIQKRTAALKAETENIDLNTAAREKARVAAELETVAKQLNKEAGLGENVVTEKQRETIDRLAESYGRAAQAIAMARSPLKTFARDSDNIGKQLNESAANWANSMTDSLVGVVKWTKTAADAFKSMADSIISDLLRTVIRKTITGPLAAGLFGFLPAFAEGTDYAPGGLSVVGEKGPEIVNLPRGSQVIPNHVAFNGGGGGQNVSLSFSIDARGADQGAVMRIQNSLKQMQRDLPSIISGVTKTQQTRGVRA